MQQFMPLTIQGLRLQHSFISLQRLERCPKKRAVIQILTTFHALLFFWDFWILPSEKAYLGSSKESSTAGNFIQSGN